MPPGPFAAVAGGLSVFGDYTSVGPPSPQVEAAPLDGQTGRMTSYCYLCAYGSKRAPVHIDPLPPGTVQATDQLGSCHSCGVLACSTHGRRVSTFECALCNGVRVVDSVLDSTAAAAPDLLPSPFPEFESVGRAASPLGIARAENALARIRSAQEDVKRAFDVEARTWHEPYERVAPQNLVLDFDSIVTRSVDTVWAFTLPNAERGPSMSLEGIAAQVRSRYALTLAWVHPRAASMVLGAVSSAYQVADTSASTDEILAGQIAPPWELSHPVVLDPAIWLIATAINQ
jgi:hypothetical protein